MENNNPVEQEEGKLTPMIWISIKHCLPEPEKEVLIYMAKRGDIESSGAPYLGWLNESKKTWTIISARGVESDAECNSDMWVVTHWADIEWPPSSTSAHQIAKPGDTVRVAETFIVRLVSEDGGHIKIEGSDFWHHASKF